MEKSIWQDGVTPPQFKKLNQNIACDVLVVGGGMAGILIANSLQKSGLDVVVVEGKKIGQGISKNTTAVISAQHDYLYTDMLKKIGKKKAKQYLDANLYAVNELIKLADDCDLEIKPSYRYSKTNRQDLENEVKALATLGYDAEIVDEISIPISIKGAVKFPNMAQFHPLKFLYKMAKDLTIYEDTYIIKVKKNCAYTKDYKISANHIVIATHFPFINSKGLYFLKMHQNRSYVIAIENNENIDGTYISNDEDGLYFRSYQNTLLVGAVDRRVGKNICGYNKVRHYIKELFPNAKELYKFAAQDCMTLDDIPYIGRYSTLQKNLYVATGFNEWGMTSSMISARIITDLITNQKNEFKEVFSPQRSILKPKLLGNLGTVVANLVKPTVKRCSHLGCALKYNKQEKTWECPCHGSRFDSKGEIIDNPAMKDTKI